LRLQLRDGEVVECPRVLRKLSHMIRSMDEMIPDAPDDDEPIPMERLSHSQLIWIVKFYTEVESAFSEFGPGGRDVFIDKGEVAPMISSINIKELLDLATSLDYLDMEVMLYHCLKAIMNYVIASPLDKIKQDFEVTALTEHHLKFAKTLVAGAMPYTS